MTCVRKNLCLKESLAYVQRNMSPLEKCRPYTFSRPSCPQKQSLAIRRPLKDQRQEPAHEIEASCGDRRLVSLSYGQLSLPPPPGPVYSELFLLWTEALGTSMHPSFHAARWSLFTWMKTAFDFEYSRLFCVTLNRCARIILYLKGGSRTGLLKSVLLWRVTLLT